MANKVRFAVIGCGVISKFHAVSINEIENAELVACFDAYKPGAERFAKEYGVKMYETLDEMLASPDIDAVCICTPSGLHTPQAVQAMKAGKHIVCEKPMSLTLAEADELINTAKETGVKVCIISQYRFAASTMEVKRAIDEGAFGTITQASLSMRYYRSNEYYNSGAWRATWAMDGGGALMNQGIHGIDVFRHLMGPVKSINGITRCLTREKNGQKLEVEDSAAAVLEFENGALGIIEGSTTCAPGYPRRIVISGDKGSVVLEEDAIVSWDLPIEPKIPVGGNATKSGSSDPTAISNAGHVLQISNLCDAILNGEELLADAYTGRLPLEIILGIYESSKTGKTVYLDK